MKRLAILMVLLSTTLASTGCCGWFWPGYGYRQGYNPNCPGGNCGVAPGVQVVPGQTGFYQSYDSNQAAQLPTQVAPGQFAPGQIATAPAVLQRGVPHRTAMIPLESLSTY